MTMWGLEAIFNPGSRHVEDEKLRLQNTREEAGDSAGGKRIDLESGTVHLTVPKKSAAKESPPLPNGLRLVGRASQSRLESRHRARSSLSLRRHRRQRSYPTPSVRCAGSIRRPPALSGLDPRGVPRIPLMGRWCLGQTCSL
jgi:hypothetical protein